MIEDLTKGVLSLSCATNLYGKSMRTNEKKEKPDTNDSSLSIASSIPGR